MASSKTEIANLALGFLGYGNEIQDLDSDTSEEARACLRFYDTARDLLFGTHPWPFIVKFATPALLEEDPTTEWQYSYQLPSDYISMRRIVDQRNAPRDAQSAYAVHGSALYTDVDDVEIEYNYRNESVTQYPAAFCIALGRLLASYIAPRLVGGLQGAQLSAAMEQMFQRDLTYAMATSGNSDSPDVPPDSELIRIRE